jgi:hypothetical protein
VRAIEQAVRRRLLVSHFVQQSLDRDGNRFASRGATFGGRPRAITPGSG